MKIFSCKLGLIQTNCYVLLDDTTGKAIVVDPGDVGKGLEDIISKNDIKNIEYIVLTHGHFDHIMGVDWLQKRTNAKVVIHKDDEIKLSDTKECRAFFHDLEMKPVKADIVVSDGDKITFGNLTVKVMHTPGHTPGSCCLICEDVMFSGDTLFAGAIGRTDLPGGNSKQILNSLKNLKNLENDYKVYPGHDINTTLERERRTNPYMRNV